MRSEVLGTHPGRPVSAYLDPDRLWHPEPRLAQGHGNRHVGGSHSGAESPQAAGHAGVGVGPHQYVTRPYHFFGHHMVAYTLTFAEVQPRLAREARGEIHGKGGQSHNDRDGKDGDRMNSDGHHLSWRAPRPNGLLGSAGQRAGHPTHPQPDRLAPVRKHRVGTKDVAAVVRR